MWCFSSMAVVSGSVVSSLIAAASIVASVSPLSRRLRRLKEDRRRTMGGVLGWLEGGGCCEGRRERPIRVQVDSKSGRFQGIEVGEEGGGPCEAVDDDRPLLGLLSPDQGSFDDDSPSNQI